MSTYGMDTDGDGMMSAAELRAYEDYKAQKRAEAEAHEQKLAAEAAAARAAMEPQYDTVPGFAARRGWHGNTLNEHSYGKALNEADAVFPYNKLKPGPMANLLAKQVSPTAGQPMEPRGRARLQGGGGCAGPVAFYEPNPLG